MLGFVLRQRLIHEVRREYEGIVEGIQSPELLLSLPLPLANEAINWPHQNILCYPLFTSQEGELCEASQSDQGMALQSPRAGHQMTDKLHSPLSAITFPTSTPDHSPKHGDNPCPQDMVITKDTIISSTDCGAHQANDEKHSYEEMSLNCLIEPLPRDREALLELRSQLTMELLWIKQAIASRQEVSQWIEKKMYTHPLHKLLILLQYLQLKKEFQSQHSATD